MLEVTGPMASFVSALRLEEVPLVARERLQVLLLDGFANLVAGGDNAPARIQQDLVSIQGGNEQATVLATGARTSTTSAAMLNVLHANTLDFDDTYRTFAHPGAMSIGPALAVAEQTHASGRDFLAAVVAGYESQIRIIEAGMPSAARRREIWGFSVWQTVGAVAASSRALGLDDERTRHAFGLGLFNAPVPNIPKMGLGDAPSVWSKNNYAWAAAGGVNGALLAERGYRGNPDILDGPGAFYLMAGSDRWDPEVALDGLGETFRFPSTSLKPYAACRWTHGALDAAAQARELLDAAPVGRATIAVHLFQDGVESLRGVAPQDLFEAQFGMAHLTALELLGRSPRHGLDERDLFDPDVLDLAGRVRLVHDDAMDGPFSSGRLPARVVVDVDGHVAAEASVDDAWGSADRPVSDEEAWAKVVALVEPRWGPGGAQRLADAVGALETCDDMTRWVRDLVAPAQRKFTPT